MADFKPGDVVQLKSGGPLMTVSINAGPAVTCEWFDDRQQVLVRAFGAVSLKQANNSPPPNQKVDSSSLREKKAVGAAAQRPPAVGMAAQRPPAVAAAAARPPKAKGEVINPVPNGGAPAV